MTSIKIIAVLICVLYIGSPDPTEPTLPEGMVLSQVEGTARLNESTGAWHFVLQRPLSDGKVTLSTGTELTILPCRGLEKIIAYAGPEKTAAIRIHAVLTRYEGRNYLFAFDAVPTRETSPQQEPAENPKTSEEDVMVIAADPNETSVIPAEILQKLRPAQKTDFARMKAVPSGTEDSLIAGRTGLFAPAGQTMQFELDGFGRNLSQRSFVLLPSLVREQTEEQLRRSPGRQRYQVSGLVTTFQGRRFLLLQRAVRTYTNGNFTP